MDHTRGRKKYDIHKGTNKSMWRNTFKYKVANYMYIPQIYYIHNIFYIQQTNLTPLNYTIHTMARIIV